MVEQTCTVTSSSTPPEMQIGSYTIMARDDGSVIFGIAIIIFFLSVLFFAILFGSVRGLKSKK